VEVCVGACGCDVCCVEEEQERNRRRNDRPGRHNKEGHPWTASWGHWPFTLGACDERWCVVCGVWCVVCGVCVLVFPLSLQSNLEQGIRIASVLSESALWTRLPVGPGLGRTRKGRVEPGLRLHSDSDGSIAFHFLKEHCKLWETTTRALAPRGSRSPLKFCVWKGGQAMTRSNTLRHGRR
jgi:hypothetical protein